MAEYGFVLPDFNLGGGEIILILALVLILFGAGKLPDLARGLGRGLFEFRKSAREVAESADDEAGEAGRSLGGIYGKPAAQALTPDNQVAELYKPAVFEENTRSRKGSKGMAAFLKQLWRWLRRVVDRFAE
jgi:sec-independent protein translocase protein TatA